jgi:hypothetical protein
MVDYIMVFYEMSRGRGVEFRISDFGFLSEPGLTGLKAHVVKHLLFGGFQFAYGFLQEQGAVRLRKV